MPQTILIKWSIFSEHRFHALSEPKGLWIRTQFTVQRSCWVAVDSLLVTDLSGDSSPSIFFSLILFHKPSKEGKGFGIQEKWKSKGGLKGKQSTNSPP